LGHMTGAVEVADLAGIDGAYLMAAAGPTKTAWAPPGERYTAFTGALLDRLVRGVPDGPELLDMRTLFDTVRTDLIQRGFPRPHQRNRDDGGRVALVRNRAFAGERPA